MCLLGHVVLSSLPRHRSRGQTCVALQLKPLLHAKAEGAASLMWGRPTLKVQHCGARV